MGIKGDRDSIKRRPHKARRSVEMARKPKVIGFEVESAAEFAAIRASVGKPVPLSVQYALGHRPILLDIENDLCLLRYPNGVEMHNVPIRDLVDDRAYWGLRG